MFCLGVSFKFTSPPLAYGTNRAKSDNLPGHTWWFLTATHLCDSCCESLGQTACWHPLQTPARFYRLAFEYVLRCSCRLGYSKSSNFFLFYDQHKILRAKPQHFFPWCESRNLTTLSLSMFLFYLSVNSCSSDKLANFNAYFMKTYLHFAPPEGTLVSVKASYVLTWHKHNGSLLSTRLCCCLLFTMNKGSERSAKTMKYSCKHSSPE